MNLALHVPASDEMAEVGAFRHHETPLKAPQPAEPSCPSQAATIELGGRRAARRALGVGGRGERQRGAKAASELYGLRRARRSKGKGARGGWTRGRGESRGSLRQACDGVASDSPAGGGAASAAAAAAGSRRGVLLRTLPINS